MMFARDARRDNSENAWMPIARTDHDRRIAWWIELVRQLLFRRGEDFFLDRLAFAVLDVEQARELGSFGIIACQQKAQRLFRSGEPSGCIQARTETKAYVVRRRN